MDVKSIINSLDNSRNCPFPMPSGEVANEWFIGRGDVIRDIVMNVVQPNGAMTNYSIIGMPRIGKSSLLKLLLKNDNIFHFDKLAIAYVSLDQCNDSSEMWSAIAHKLTKALKRKFKGSEELNDLETELDFREISLTPSQSEVGYNYLCELAEALNDCGFRALILIDEFDKFSDIADRTIVGNFRTLFNGAEFGIRTILASRRTVARIENEVKGAVNANVSTLAPLFPGNCTIHLKPFNSKETEEYWEKVGERISNNVTKAYRNAVEHFTGGHPMLLNLLNYAYWGTMHSDDYLWNNDEPSFDNQLTILHEAFITNIWNEVERWKLHTTLILHTWGPDSEEDPASVLELTNYGIFDTNYTPSPLGPLSVAISLHFTKWLKDMRYALPFTDVWSKAERNLRQLVKKYCEDNFSNDEELMFSTLITNAYKFEKTYSPKQQRFTALVRIENMKSRRTQNTRVYPMMSKWAIDYSDPSDIPELFIRRDMDWFGQIFSGKWQDWESKFKVVGEMRNIHYHHNDGVPKARIEVAKKYCQEINLCIENYLQQS